jgi:hypothetical protein
MVNLVLYPFFARRFANWEGLADMPLYDTTIPGRLPSRISFLERVVWFGCLPVLHTCCDGLLSGVSAFECRGVGRFSLSKQRSPTPKCINKANFRRPNEENHPKNSNATSIPLHLGLSFCDVFHILRGFLRFIPTEEAGHFDAEYATI